MALASPPQTDTALREARRRRASDLAYQRQLAQMYRDAFRGVLAEVDRLGKYIETQKAKGAPVSPSWLNRQERYLALQSQLERSIRQYGGEVNDLLRQQRVVAARDGLTGLREEVAAQMGATGRLENIRGFGADVWGRIDQRAMDNALDLISQTDSPLNNLIQQMAPNALAAFQAAWSRGMASGQNPNKIARNLKASIQGMTQGRAQLIARTEWHRAVRTARSEAFTESRVVKAWVWRAALDGRTCGICFANHGTEHPTDERLPGHPGCRCTMVPKTVDWSELGVPAMGNTRPPITPGSALFAGLSDARQLALLGRGRFNLYKAGHSLDSLMHVVANPTWGPMAKWKPLPPKGFPTKVLPLPPSNLPQPWKNHPSAPWTEMVPMSVMDNIPRGNPTGKTDIGALQADILMNGFKEPLQLTYSVKDKAVVLDEGNHRIVAAKAAGLTEVPVTVFRVNGSLSVPGKRVAGSPADEFGYVPGQLKPSDIFTKKKRS